MSALIVIDIQNDYFPGGAFPLFEPEVTMDHIVKAIETAKSQGIKIVLVQHVASKPGLFFNTGTKGVEIVDKLKNLVPDAPVVVKSHADSFLDTTLEKTLSSLNVSKLYICGMMTQNCVTHTSISKSAEKYDITVLADACTTVSKPIHLIALNALGDRVKVVPNL